MSERMRYERYQAYCLLLGSLPATFEAWRKENDRIYERAPLAWYAQNGYVEQFA